MKGLTIVACLAMAALYASALPVEQERQRESEKPARRDLKTCGKALKEAWLNTNTGYSFEYQVEYDQYNRCAEFIPVWNRIIDDNADCYRAFSEKDIGQSILSSSAWIDAEKKVYERRVQAQEICRRMYEKYGEGKLDKSKRPPKPEDDSLSVEFCAQAHLKDSDGFRKLPENFESLKEIEQKNICEEAAEKSDQLEIRACTTKFPHPDMFLKAYDEEDRKKYDQIKAGALACAPHYLSVWSIDLNESQEVKDSEK